jgi:hypothetical protein
MLFGSRDHQTQFCKGVIQGPFHQSVVQIGPVASEELIKMWKDNGRTDDRRRTLSGDISSPGSGELNSYCIGKKRAWICVMSKVKVGFLTVDIFRVSVFFLYAIKCMLIFGANLPIRYPFHEIWVSLRLNLRWILYESSFFLFIIEHTCQLYRFTR